MGEQPTAEDLYRSWGYLDTPPDEPPEWLVGVALAVIVFIVLMGIAQ